jgi:hypothetical protein
MTSKKKRKRVRAINSYEFETFTLTHIAADLADLISFLQWELDHIMDYYNLII